MKSNVATQFRRHRSRSNSGWCVSDAQHLHFIDSFNTALVSSVKFIHEAPRMICVPGYDSTGEASGVIEARDVPVVMPPEAVVSHEIIYDRERRRFHVVGQPNNIVDAADFAVLQVDGNAQAGWKADSQCAPEWLKIPAVA